ncbi:methyl-accepting chemotaxis protein [Rhizobium lemnae]|uniref:Methyl-accepting chemotaxis protein n=1 Tax=Rhizobium lemnae TaxID=1214924 RepID=A0ABV8E5J7_9HYPH|nr:methyl-accepting chemotaxis protein [Rhizobium lemnae]MCJ8509478.1 methyl-accepting chemotaxis protein [Rhizobium lemnae]
MFTLTISRMTVLFGILVTTGIVSSFGVQRLALGELKVGGPVFSQIVDGKDLVADILPPPLYLVEAYGLATEVVIHRDDLSENVKKVAKLRQDYEDRRKFWQASDLPDDIKGFLLNDVLVKGDLFWSQLDSSFAVLAAGSDVANAQQSFDMLQKMFRDHQAAVVRLVDMSNAWMKSTEAAASKADSKFSNLAIGGSILSLMIFLAGLWFMKMRAIGPLTAIGGYMSRLAAGDYSQEVPFAQRGDEIGDMARSVQTFRSAALERKRLREEMEAGRVLSDEARALQERQRVAEAAQLKQVVDSLGAALRRLAECNISQPLDEEFAAQFEALRIDFNDSIATFQETIEQVLLKTGQINDNAMAMNEAANNLSKRTEQQAAALEQTAASLEEVTSTVKASVDRTAETRNLVRDARACTMKSSGVVTDAIEAMKRIEGASSEIGKIVDVIDQIAFQTNLLALNAGVEAARAGEAGKGFAVVAQEVRDLAQRSAAAAKEINALIGKSRTEVATGVQLVVDTGGALQQIETFVSEIDVKVEAITTASREQAIGLSEISEAVNSIDQMTQKNASMVEETTFISNSLAADSNLLSSMVGRFQLNHGRYDKDETTHHPKQVTASAASLSLRRAS